MKRLSFSILTFVLGTTLLTGPSFAGLDVRQYHTDFLKQKGIKKGPSAEEKGFEHKSKYQREEKEGTAAPQKEGTTPKQPSKYERRYWEPAQQ